MSTLEPAGGVGVLDKPDTDGPSHDEPEIEHIICVNCFPDVKEGDPIVTLCGTKKICGPLHSQDEMLPGALCTMCVEVSRMRSHICRGAA
jgi:hypothetical protein